MAPKPYEAPGRPRYEREHGSRSEVAHLTLIAVLAAPCASYAAETVTRPGPFTVPKTQFACQNLLDHLDLRRHVSAERRETFWAAFNRHNTPEQEAMGFACIKVGKGAKVIVKDRWISLECVDIINRPSTRCFFIENVSGDKRPDHDPWYPL